MMESEVLHITIAMKELCKKGDAIGDDRMHADTVYVIHPQNWFITWFLKRISVPSRIVSLDTVKYQFAHSQRPEKVPLKIDKMRIDKITK